MSKFYILSEEEIYKMHGYADQREWDEPEIFRKEVLNPAYEVEFDGDLREFVREKIENEKRYQKFLDESVKIARPGYLLTPNELRVVLEKKGLKEGEK